MDSKNNRKPFIKQNNMIYQIQIQFIPGNDMIWVAKLNPEDSLYEYDNIIDAQTKATELQDADTTGRQYRVAEL
jgi:hypothetical protein